MKWTHTLESPFDRSTEHIDDLANKMSIELPIGTDMGPEILKIICAREEEKEKRNRREVIKFSDYFKALGHVDKFYRPEIELYLLAGMSPSEMAGLHVNSQKNGCLRILWTVTDKTLSDHPKKKSRIRNIPLTKALSRVLGQAMEKKREDSPFIFQTKTGLPLYDRPIRDAWYRACDKAEVERVAPYSLRHCFVAYCEQMKINKPRITGLMGHVDKSMIDNVYGRYINGIEEDLEAIKDYFGEDFWGEG